MGKTKQEWQQLELQYRPEWIIFLVGFILGAIIFQMNKQLQKNNIIKLQKETLRNILSSKGIIYRYYLRSLQQKHQSNQVHFPILYSKQYPA